MKLETLSLWQIIFLAALISYALRALPFLFARAIGDIPANFQRTMDFFAYAVIGSLIGEVVFAPLLESVPTPAAWTDFFLRVIVVTLAFFVELRLKRQLVSLALSYGTFVLLYLTLRTT